MNAKATEKEQAAAPQAKRNEKVLIVDDEASIRRILETRFKMLGYETAVASDGEEAVQVFENFNPDIVILDIMMPKMDGYGVTKEIRRNNDTPIIILTALGDVSERITGLELGADDYVVKPFSPKELEARVKSILRRTYGKNGMTSQKETNNVIQIGQIRIDTNKRQVFRKNERVRLTGMEFSLLELLVTNSGTPYSRGEILQHVWSYPEDHRIDTRVVDVHISRLRSKLENDISNPELILTARGIGYMFQKINQLEVLNLMPSPRPMTSPRHGFTMMEALVAIALCGLLAIFLVPKLLRNEKNEQSAVLVQDTYTTLGELYLAREEDTSIATAPDIGGNERAVFGEYLRTRLRVRPPALGAIPANYCTASNYFILQSGAIIRSICDDNTTNPDTLQVTIRIPNNNGSNTDFILTIPEDGAGSGASSGRYTTLFGFKMDNGIALNPGDCGFADRALKLTTDCPLTSDILCEGSC